MNVYVELPDSRNRLLLRMTYRHERQLLLTKL